jgi:triacylglycerol lipase
MRWLIFHTLFLFSTAAWPNAQNYTQTRYPIVLAHGLLGFASISGVLDYWHGIPEELTKGGAQVFTTHVSQFNSTQARGDQLLAQVEEIMRKTGAAKVNLIGHSHGGLDARYVAGKRPDLVASVTTVATPNSGAELADAIRNNVGEGSWSEWWLNMMFNAFGNLIRYLANQDEPQDALGSLDSLTTKSVGRFNDSYPKGMPHTPCGEGEYSANGILFYSWSGEGQVTTGVDMTDWLFELTSRAYDKKNDGLVETCSSHFGRVIRDNYGLNHMDIVNGLWGLVPTREPNPVALFRIHANRLKKAGL